jgi:hypothetical protein
MQVKVNPTETKTDAAEATPTTTPVNGVVSVKLEDGRTVGIRRMGPMDRMRMCSIIGAENSKNEIYLSMALPAYCAATIEGEIVPRPQTVLALEAVADRLGDAALLQINLAIGEHFSEGDLTKIIDEFKKRQEIKN